MEGAINVGKDMIFGTLEPVGVWALVSSQMKLCKCLAIYMSNGFCLIFSEFEIVTNSCGTV